MSFELRFKADTQVTEAELLLCERERGLEAIQRIAEKKRGIAHRPIRLMQRISGRV
ncbi:hypothetical protein [Treponema endosymbiont of Eucomonympha sp.]|uniref:hypothetical protein n=1 Tax=Treponema endosymbiont of Eucomonympha sp. TaxID=1580831 RepID=UPI000B1ADD26|nr:hypothetical protein [Treponema endosymbiont of Eucomonympha sp.]